MNFAAGVFKEIRKAGDGVTFPRPGSNLSMHYTGKFTDGRVFDSSVSRNKAFNFKIGVGQVIKGWDEGVMQMSLGEEATLYIRSDYGYGERGAGGVIPPNTNLIFDVTLLSIN